MCYLWKQRRLRAAGVCRRVEERIRVRLGRCFPLPPPQVHSKCSLRTSSLEYSKCMCDNPQQIPLSWLCPSLFDPTPTFRAQSIIWQEGPELSCFRTLSILVSYLSAVLNLYFWSRKRRTRSTHSIQEKGRNSTINLYTHTMLCSPAFLIIPNILTWGLQQASLGVLWFFSSDYNSKISSLIGISGITANINQEFLYLPMQKMSHVSTFNSICYFKGPSFKIMLPSYNFSQLSFKSIHRCTYKHKHLFTCTNKYITFSLINFNHFISFSIWFKATLRSRVHRSHTASPGISWRPPRAFSEALGQITWICKTLLAAKVRNRSTVLPV